TEEEAPFIPPTLVVSRQNRERVLRWIALIGVIIALFYAGNFLWKKLPARKISGAPFVTQIVNDLTVNFIHPQGQLRQGNNEILIEFRSADRSSVIHEVTAQTERAGVTTEA